MSDQKCPICDERVCDCPPAAQTIVLLKRELAEAREQLVTANERIVESEVRVSLLMLDETTRDIQRDVEHATIREAIQWIAAGRYSLAKAKLRGIVGKGA